MIDVLDLESPAIRGTVVGMLGIACSLYLPLLSPVITIYFFYQGKSWYISPNRKYTKVGVGLLILGILLSVYSYLVITGYFTTPGFESL